MRFSSMLNRIMNYSGEIAYRSSWPENVWISVGMHGKQQCLLYHDDISTWPYSVQQADLFASDWRTEDG